MMDNYAAKQRLTRLVLRAQAGDREAVDILLENHQRELFGYLTKLLGNRDDAEDTLQAALLQAVKKLRWLREPTYFRTWLFQIASRKAYRLINRKKRRKEFSNIDFIDTPENRDTGSDEKTELIEQIPIWLARLTPKGREAVILHYLQGFTTEEVAEILEIPVGTAKSRISYSLASIRKQLNSSKSNEGENHE